MTNIPSVEEIQEWLVTNIADRLEMKPEEIDLDEPITHLGLSSREAIMLSGELEEWLGYELPPELLYEYPEIKPLAEKLALGPEAFSGKASESEEWYYPIETDSASYVALVRERVRAIPDQTAFVFLRNGEDEHSRITYKQLDTRARAIAAKLQQMNLEGERALLTYPSGIDFITGFFGCLYAKVVAVPAYPPTKTRGTERIEAIVNDSGAKIAMTTQEELDSVLKNRKIKEDAFIHQMETFTTESIPDEMAEQWVEPELNHDTLAFLQYTSGSTGNPKGVMVSHGNILWNCKALRMAYKPQKGIITLGWLPMFHDMGLIGHILAPISFGGTNVAMPPNSFLEKPIRWLRAITKYKSNLSAAPNFAFDHCVDKIKEEELDGLDFSSWQAATNGSEVVREETLERFTKRFAPYGFKRETFYPNYGMAEATLMISAGTPNTEPKILFLDGPALEQNEVVMSDPGLETTISKVGCGIPRSGELVVADIDKFTKLPDGKVGEIWFRGGSVAQGYWGREDQTKLIFDAHLADTNEGPFMRTGDLGFLHEGEVYITGRLKDLIIIRGRNHYPHDIEQTVQNSHHALTINGGAAFTVDAFNEERLVIVQEVERKHLQKLDQEEVFEKIRLAVTEEHDIQVYAIMLLSPGRLPRTTSGKIQRRASKKGFLDDSLRKVGEWRLPLQAVEEGGQRDSFAPDLLDLLDKTINERIPVLQNYFQTLIARILRMPIDSIGLKKPVINLGLDSMHAIEIKGFVESDLGFEIEVIQFMEGITIADLAVFSARKLDDVEEKIRENASKAPVEDAPVSSNGKNLDEIDADTARELLVDIDNLSQEEVEKLLEILENE